MDETALNKEFSLTRAQCDFNRSLITPSTQYHEHHAPHPYLLHWSNMYIYVEIIT